MMLHSHSLEESDGRQPDVAPHRRSMERVLGSYLRWARAGHRPDDKLHVASMIGPAIRNFWGKHGRKGSDYRRRFFEVQARTIGKKESDKEYLVDSFREFLRMQIIASYEVDEQRAGYVMPISEYVPRFDRLDQVEDELRLLLEARIEALPREPLTIEDFIQMMFKLNGAEFMKESLRAQYSGISERLEEMDEGDVRLFSRDAWSFFKMMEDFAQVQLQSFGFGGRLRQNIPDSDHPEGRPITHRFNIGLANSDFLASLLEVNLPAGLYEQIDHVAVVRV